MAYTQSDIDALDAALKTGALTVRYENVATTYRSLEEMRTLRSIMLRDVQAAAGKKVMRQVRIYSQKGL